MSEPENPDTTREIAWRHKQLTTILVPLNFAEDLIILAQRWDRGETTTVDEIAVMEILVAYQTGNLDEQETLRALGNITLAELRRVIRDAAQKGMLQADKDGTARLQISTGDRKVKPLDLDEQGVEEETVQPGLPAHVPPPQIVPVLLSHDPPVVHQDGLARLLHSAQFKGGQDR